MKKYGQNCFMLSFKFCMVGWVCGRVGGCNATSGHNSLAKAEIRLVKFVSWGRVEQQMRNQVVSFVMLYDNQV